MSALDAMNAPIGRQRTLESPHFLQEHMLVLAARLGSTMPRPRCEGISGPLHGSHERKRSGPFVRASVLRGLLGPLVEREGIGRVACWSGMSERTLFRIMYGDSLLVTVALADDLICGGLGDPSLWASTPELEYVNLRGEPV